MRKLVLLMLLIIIHSVLFCQGLGSITGKITDQQTNEVLRGATVSIKGTSIAVLSNNEGKFVLQQLSAGRITLIVSYVGYKAIELPVVVEDAKATATNIRLAIDDRMGNAIVVSASKRPEKITNAPASIQVIGAKDFNQYAGSNVGELASTVQGIEYTRSGVDEITFNARGFNSAFNLKVFQLVDGRNSMSTLSGSLPVFNNGSTQKDDLERIEIVLGPQAALYGPNAHNALFNFITKDPRKYSGTTVSLSAGSQSQFSGRLRNASKINNKWAYKFSGEYAKGEDYKWYDTVYAGNQPPSVYTGDQPPPGTTPFYGPAVSIAERNVNFNFRRYRGEAHVYHSLTAKTDIIISGGGSNVNRLQVTTGGRNQLQNVTYGFIQGRIVHPRYFINVYNTWGSLGTTYIIGSYTRDYWNRTHSTITDPNHPQYPSFGRLSPDEAEANALRLGNTAKEDNQRLNAELQYNYNFQKQGLFLVAGASYQKDRPNGYGINLVDSFEKIKVVQYGIVLHVEKTLPISIRLITSLRFDHHSNFGNFFSPKLAIVTNVGDGSLRLTWGQAFSMPSILNQYAGVNRLLFGNGTGIWYVPNGVYKYDTASFKTTAALKPEQVKTWEIGYKGTIVKKLFADINLYNGTSINFISPQRSVAGRALSVNGIPVTHNKDRAGSFGSDDKLSGASFSTFFNYGEVRAYGLDAGLTFSFNKILSVGLRYSWFGSDITKDDAMNDANTDGYVSLEERSLNAPQQRGSVIANFQNLLKQKLFITVAGRFVQEYDFYSGNQIGTAAGKGARGIVFGGTANTTNGPLPRWYLKNFDWGPLGGFLTVDINAGYNFNEMVSVNMGITNLFGTRQIEFVGSPSIGRLFMFELKVHVPNTAKE